MREQQVSKIRLWLSVIALIACVAPSYSNALIRDDAQEPGATTKTTAALAGRNQNAKRKAKNEGRSTSVSELRSLENLREAFEQDSGKVRLIALLSPT